MNLPLRTLLAVGVLTVAAQAKIERTVEKSFTVQPGGTFHAESQGGDIRIVPSSESVVKVTARETIKAGSESEADELLKKLTLTIEQQGNDVTAISKYENQTGLHWGSWPPVQVDFIVSVPAKFSADLKTSGGDINIGDLEGRVRAHTSGGDVKLAHIGGEVDGDTSGGNMSLVEGRSSVTLKTSGGDITVGHAVGVTLLKTSGGNIKLDSVDNTLDARTSGGDIRAAIVGPLKGDCLLSTSGGKVKVTVDSSAAFHLDASTSGGDVDAAGLTITIERGGQGKSKLSGDVNGGGPNLKVHSSGGDLVISTAKK